MREKNFQSEMIADLCDYYGPDETAELVMSGCALEAYAALLEGEEYDY